MFVTLLEVNEENPVVVEVSVHAAADTESLVADVTREDGTIVAPTIVRRIPLRESELERQRAIRQFIHALAATLPGVVRDAVGSNALAVAEDLEYLRAPMRSGVPSTVERLDFELHVKDVMSRALGVLLSPERLAVSNSTELPFALVSPDHRIVGDVRVDFAGRIPTATISDLVLKLIRVRGAKRRLLVIGPSRRSLDRWVRRYGPESASPIELWQLANEHLERI
jgi:hypothetical protein